MVRPDLETVMGHLDEVLSDARDLGYLGRGPVRSHVGHAWPLVERLPTTGLAIDLGSGGGVPGLVLALASPGLAWVLVESQQRRSAWLTEAVRRLGLPSVTVRWERAEVTGRGSLRQVAAVVVARSFGRPAVTVECAAPLLAPAGVLWVAEPPEPTIDRWPEAGLAALGLDAEGVGVDGWVGFRSVSPCPDRYPRRAGIPKKRPLFP